MTELRDCFMCQDPMFKLTNDSSPQKIIKLGVSTAILNRDWQFFRGTTILVFQDHVTELHHLTDELQLRFMQDAVRMADALVKTYPGVKLNHGLFGNTIPHLHWHIIVRRESDPDPKSTIWESNFPKLNFSDEEFQTVANEILRNL